MIIRQGIISFWAKGNAIYKVKRKRIRLLDDLSCAKGTFSMFLIVLQTQRMTDHESIEIEGESSETNSECLRWLRKSYVKFIIGRRNLYDRQEWSIRRDQINALFIADENTLWSCYFREFFMKKILMRPCNVLKYWQFFYWSEFVENCKLPIKSCKQNEEMWVQLISSKMHRRFGFREQHDFSTKIANYTSVKRFARNQ